MKNKILFILDIVIFLSVCMEALRTIIWMPSLLGVGGFCAIGAWGLSLYAALRQEQETEEVFQISLFIAGFQTIVFLVYCLYPFL